MSRLVVPNRYAARQPSTFRHARSDQRLLAERSTERWLKTAAKWEREAEPMIQHGYAYGFQLQHMAQQLRQSVPAIVAGES